MAATTAPLPERSGLSSLSASHRSRLPSTRLAMSVCPPLRPFKQLLLIHPVAISPTVMAPCNVVIILPSDIGGVSYMNCESARTHVLSRRIWCSLAVGSSVNPVWLSICTGLLDGLWPSTHSQGVAPLPRVHRPHQRARLAYICCLGRRDYHRIRLYISEIDTSIAERHEGRRSSSSS